MRTLLLLLLSSTAYGQLSLAAISACAGNNTTSTTCAVGVVAVDKLIVVGVGAIGGSGTTTVSDGVTANGESSAYTQIGTDSTTGGVMSSLWYKVSKGTSSRTLTIATGGAARSWVITPNVVAGANTTTPIDQNFKNVIGSGASVRCPATGSDFTRTGNEMIIGTATTNASGNPVGGGASPGFTDAGSTGTFTIASYQPNGNCCTAGTSSYQYITSGTSYHWTIGFTSGSTGFTFACSAVSIKEAPAVARRRVIGGDE